MRFARQTAIVTGASRGIGLSVAQRLVADGARVVITARNQDSLDEALSALGGAAQALGVAGKADDEEHQQHTVRLAMSTFGSVDLLVNNAGINPTYGPLLELDLNVARKVVEVNCLAALSWVQQAHRAWMGEHGGSVVNISSVAGTRAAPGIGFYGASKAMLSHLTAQLAVELGPGIRVNAVAPAVVKTRFASPLYEGNVERVASRYPLKRLGLPADVAALVTFLLSTDASWITGQLVVLDGGLTLAGGV
jgi:NAD(P)-dependent dehydrogenase (short-subunit alcohol dehydrogenase family)